MIYVKINSSNEVVKYPYTINDFKLENPNNKITANTNLDLLYENTKDAIDNECSVVIVEAADSSTIELAENQKIEETNPTYDETTGMWNQNFSIIELSQEEIDFENSILIEKNLEIKQNKLDNVAWAQDENLNTDLTAEQIQEYADYISLIDNIDSDINWPNIDWPDMPYFGNSAA